MQVFCKDCFDGADGGDDRRIRPTLPTQVAMTEPSLLWLLSHGFDVNEADDYGHSPLHVLAAAGDDMTIQLLLRHGADIDRQVVHFHFTHPPLLAHSLPASIPASLGCSPALPPHSTMPLLPLRLQANYRAFTALRTCPPAAPLPCICRHCQLAGTNRQSRGPPGARVDHLHAIPTRRCDSTDVRRARRQGHHGPAAD